MVESLVYQHWFIAPLLAWFTKLNSNSKEIYSRLRQKSFLARYLILSNSLLNSTRKNLNFLFLYSLGEILLHHNQCTRSKQCLHFQRFVHLPRLSHQFINIGLSLHCRRGLPNSTQIQKTFTTDWAKQLFWASNSSLNSTKECKFVTTKSPMYIVQRGQNSQVLFNPVLLRSLTDYKTCVLSIIRPLARWEHILIDFQHISNRELESRNKSKLLSILLERRPFAVCLYCKCSLQNFELFWI